MGSIERNAPCWCGSGQKYKKCHLAFDERIASFHRQGHIVPDHKMIKTPEQIQKIRESAKINIAVLDYVAAHIKAGVTTKEIDDWVYRLTTQAGGIPAPLNFEGFPNSVCTSINDQVCHGIPSSDIVLKEGDIVKVDASTMYNGYYSDSSRMFCIGEVAQDKRRLVQVTKEAMELGLAQVKPWGFLGDMAQAVNDHVTKNGYSVVREIGGHGIGLAFTRIPGWATSPNGAPRCSLRRAWSLRSNLWSIWGLMRSSWMTAMDGPCTQRIESHLPSGRSRYWSRRPDMRYCAIELLFFVPTRSRPLPQTPRTIQTHRPSLRLPPQETARSMRLR